MKKGLEIGFPHMGIMGHFLWGIWTPQGSFTKTISFFAFFSHKNCIAPVLSSVLVVPSYASRTADFLKKLYRDEMISKYSLICVTFSMA